MNINWLTIGIACLLLAGCSDLQKGEVNAADTVGNETSASYNDMRDLLGIGHAKPAPQVKNQPSYCYRTNGDTVCYARPIPGQEYRLEAYQDAHGHTGYTLPYNYGTDEEEKKEKKAEEKAKKLPPLASTTVGPPPPVAGVGPQQPQKKLKEVVFDPAELQPKTLVPEKMQ